MASYRARASTISNGQVARLKTLMEGEVGSLRIRTWRRSLICRLLKLYINSFQGGSEDSFRKGGTRSRVAKGSRQSRKKKIPTVFRLVTQLSQLIANKTIQFVLCSGRKIRKTLCCLLVD